MEINKKLRYITTLMLFFVFILPTAVKLEHSHVNNLPDSANDDNNIYPVLQNNCLICNFEFSIFKSPVQDIELKRDDVFDRYINHYNSRYHSDLPEYSFSLRGPPETGK